MTSAPSASTEAADRVVAALIQARKDRVLVPVALYPVDVLTAEDAIRIQSRLVTEMGLTVAGWKVTVTPDGRTIAGAVVSDRMFTAPVTLSPVIAGLSGLEGEIAFVMAKTPMASSGTVLTRDDVIAAVSGICAAIEIVDSRWELGTKSPAGAQVADFNNNGALITGPVITDWQHLSFADIPVRLVVNGVALVDQKGGHVSGDVIGWLTSLANHLAARGEPLTVGQIVTTGSYTGMPFGKPGDVVECAFAGLPGLTVTLGS